MTVVIPGSAVAAVVVLALGSCGRHDQPSLFTVTEAARIGTVSPATGGWSWPKAPVKPSKPSKATNSGATDPLLARFRQQTSALVDLGEKGNTWHDADKLGNLAVGVYASASDAHRAFAPFNALALGWAKKTGTVRKAEHVDGLGEEAWRLWVAGNGSQATYHWRRGNLLLETHIQCYGRCSGNVDTAVHAWADAVDRIARGDS